MVTVDLTRRWGHAAGHLPSQKAKQMPPVAQSLARQMRGRAGVFPNLIGTSLV